MAENKKSFVAYSDWHGMFKALPDEVAGKLIKHVFSYVNDENPSSEDFIINALFEQIKATLKRDLVKWDSQREQRSLAGKKSAELRSTKSNERSTVVNENVRKATVSVSDSVNDSVINNKADKIDFDALILFINKTFGRSFKKVSPTVKAKYNARLKDGYTKEDFKTAMTNCSKLQFHIDNNFQYCTPEYFSRSEVIDKYSNVTEQEPEKELRITDPDTDLANYVNAQVAKYRSV
jgi:uncharacterized phage protein (TIGR02220 family)